MNRLQQLAPDMWYRQLPSYAAMDSVPQLMDTDLTLTFTRVGKTVRDSGMVVV